MRPPLLRLRQRHPDLRVDTRFGARSFFRRPACNVQYSNSSPPPPSHYIVQPPHGTSARRTTRDAHLGLFEGRFADRDGVDPETRISCSRRRFFSPWQRCWALRPRLWLLPRWPVRWLRLTALLAARHLRPSSSDPSRPPLTPLSRWSLARSSRAPAFGVL